MTGANFLIKTSTRTTETKQKVNKIVITITIMYKFTWRLAPFSHVLVREQCTILRGTGLRQQLLLLDD